MKKKIAVTCLLGSFFAQHAKADLLIDPSSSMGGSRTKLAGVFSSSEITYDRDNSEFDVERKILGLEIGHGLSSGFDLVGQLGLIAETQVEGFRKDGEGFILGAGGRFQIMQSSSLQLRAHAVLSYQNETIKIGNYEYQLITKELQAGLTTAFQVGRTIVPYATLNLIPFDDGEEKTSTNGGQQSQGDIDRDDMFSLKLGANFNLNAVSIRPELTLLGEQTFVLAVGGFL